MRYVAMTAVLLVVTLSGARADMFDIKNFPEREKFHLGFRYKGLNLAKPVEKPFSRRYMVAEASINAVYESRFVGEGPNRHLEVSVNNTSQNGYTSRFFLKLKPGSKMILSYIENNVFLPSGKKIRTEAYDLSESIPPWPDDMAHPLTLPLALRGWDFVPGNQRKFYMWFNPSMVFAMNVRVRGEETVTVPAGTFQCYRLDIEPDLVDVVGPVLGRVIKPFVNKNPLWVEKKFPHRLVKYQGSFGMINISAAGTEIFELTKIVE